MTKVRDLTGQRFGRLVVIKPVGKNKSGNKIWLCRCDCGNYKEVVNTNLTSGGTQSCGCLRNELTIERNKELFFKDISGQKFGRLIAIEHVGKNQQGGYQWRCICDCGNEIIVNSSSLISGSTQSCGCLKNERIHDANFKDITGNRYGKLLVIELYGKNEKNTYLWSCICDCGNTCVVSGVNLRVGRTKSCGCLQLEKSSENGKKLAKDLTGQRFGRLIVIKRAGSTNSRMALWECKCDCGNSTIVTGSALRGGHTKSCGCLNSDICGDLNPNWFGGISFGPYCPKFNTKKKEEIREQYGRVCLICGKTEEENGQRLDIHHIDYRKDQGCGDHKWQLVPLCRECHSKTNHNRTFWEFNIKWILAQRKSKGL